MLDDLSYETFKEPRGFIKVLQWIFAICAFATTVNFSSISSVNLVCSETNTTVKPLTIQHIVEYPFDLDQGKNTMPIPICKPSPGNISNTLDCAMVGNAKSDSEFFVTIGVLSFLYATALIALFVLADKTYLSDEKYPKIDFWITAVFTLFWLAAFSAWAHGLSNVRTGADPQSWQVVMNITETGKTVPVLKEVPLCNHDYTGYNCSNVQTGIFGGIVISILFGFINFILWGANIWFLYKETWFDRVSSSGNPSTSGI